MIVYRCSKCNKVLEEIGIPPQIQMLQMYKQVVNVGSTEVPEEIKKDPFLYRGFYCSACNMVFCPSCSNMQYEHCPSCRRPGLLPGYRPLLKRIKRISSALGTPFTGVKMQTSEAASNVQLNKAVPLAQIMRHTLSQFRALSWRTRLIFLTTPVLCAGISLLLLPSPRRDLKAFLGLVLAYLVAGLMVFWGGWYSTDWELEEKRLAEAEAKRAPNPPVSHDEKEEDYVRRCSEAAFLEEKEDRTFRSDPAFQPVLDLLNSQQYSAAIKAVESLLSRFSDFDLPYKWLASAYRSTNQLQRSQEVLGQGLAKAKRKSMLLTDLGETEWQMGNIHQAVYCWCQALHCLSSNPIDYNAYLLLSYVAKGCGLSDVERRLLGRVDAMRGGQIRLDAATADRLTSLVRGKKDSAMSRAVQGIDTMYLRAA
jgi:tetratricopeptide (TPR) repeat protein